MRSIERVDRRQVHVVLDELRRGISLLSDGDVEAVTRRLILGIDRRTRRRRRYPANRTSSVTLFENKPTWISRGSGAKAVEGVIEEDIRSRPARVRQKLSAVNDRIKKLLKGGGSYMLSVEGKRQLGNLFRIKNHFMIEALKLRQQGTETIKAYLVVNSVADLRFHPLNDVVVCFVISEDHPFETYRTHAPFAMLQDTYDGDLRGLLGTPDDFLANPPLGWING